mgnify:CR=1 FL=1
MRFGMKFDKKGIPAFVLILIMMFQGNNSAAVDEAAIASFTEPMTLTLVDESLDALLPTLGPDALVLDAATLPETVNLLVTTDCAEVDAIQFLLDDENLRLDDEPTFTVADEETGWRLPDAGEHTLTALPFTTIEDEAVEAGEPLVITFSVAESTASEEKETP